MGKKYTTLHRNHESMDSTQKTSNDYFVEGVQMTRCLLNKKIKVSRCLCWCYKISCLYSRVM